MQVEREIQIHSQLDHENVIKLFAAFEDAENVYLAQEFAAGEACSRCMCPCIWLIQQYTWRTAVLTLKQATSQISRNLLAMLAVGGWQMPLPGGGSSWSCLHMGSG